MASFVQIRSTRQAVPVCMFALQALLHCAVASDPVFQAGCSVDEASCGKSTFSQESVMLQKGAAQRSLSEHQADSATDCAESEVSRRRQAGSMCSCRRRSGPTCQSSRVILDPARESEIKVMSYNLFGWNAFNVNKKRSENVLRKIQDWSPTVLGAQEVEKGGYGYDEVKDEVKAATGLAHAGGSQFFDDNVVEKLETSWTDLLGGYWMSMTRFKIKSNGDEFLFFNSHWKHDHGQQQAEIVANAIQAARARFGPLPTLLVGDTNQFCRGYEGDAWKYLKGEVGSSPVVFEDVVQHDQGKSFSDGNNPDCRVDFVLASKGEWLVRQSDVDRDGMGASGTASDHAPIMAELAPIARSSTQ